MRTFQVARAGVITAMVFVVSGCGGSSGSGVPEVQGTRVVTRGIESYVTDHNGYRRGRITLDETKQDRTDLENYDAGGSASPDDLRNLIADSEALFGEDTIIEVVAEVTSDGPGGEEITRILRLTADQAPYRNVNSAGEAVTEGQFFFRGVGQHLVWASTDGETILSGQGDLENLMIDFGAESATIHLRTPFNPDGGSDLETEIMADDLTFNIASGAFGGEVTLTNRVDADTTLTATGVLRGNITATRTGLSGTTRDMTASGLYGVESDEITAQGVFSGAQPD